MSVLISDIRYYGSTDMPEADSATVGGAINFNLRPEFDASQLSPSMTFSAVSSSSSDTATKIIFVGLDSTGVSHTETLSLNGTTKVSSTNSYERLLSALASGAPSVFALTTPGGTQAVGDIALLGNTAVETGTAQGAANATSSTPAYLWLASGQGATAKPGMVIQITNNTPSGAEYQLRRILVVNPNGLGADYVAVDRNWTTTPTSSTTYGIYYGMHFELAGSNGGVALTGTSTQVLGITQIFANTVAQASGGSNTTYYEKIFVCNNNQSTSLTSVSLDATTFSPSLPSGATFSMGLSASLDDTTTSTNRQTAPASITFTAQPGSINVPSPGNLPASTGAGSATSVQAIWFSLLLDAGTAAYETIVTLQTQGTTT